jgi:hypothetical protein
MSTSSHHLRVTESSESSFSSLSDCSDAWVSAQGRNDCSGGACVDGRLLAYRIGSDPVQCPASLLGDCSDARVSAQGRNDRSGGACVHGSLLACRKTGNVA